MFLYIKYILIVYKYPYAYNQVYSASAKGWLAFIVLPFPRFLLPIIVETPSPCLISHCRSSKIPIPKANQLFTLAEWT